MRFPKTLFGAAIVTACAGCAQLPVAPSIAVMPAPGMPFEVFEQDNNLCRQYAQQQLGANPQQVANNQVIGGAVAGTVIGAAAGALLSGGRGYGVQSGAATGLLFGTAAGAGAAGQTSMTLQQRYNIAFAQCMYAKGNQVPGFAAPRYAPPPPPSEPPPSSGASPPPPPPGQPPPPPPGSDDPPRP